MEDYQLENTIQNIEYNIQQLNQQLNQKLDQSLHAFSNMQIMLNTLTEIVHSQVNVLNQISQQVNHLTLKLTDMDINNQNNDSMLSDLAENQLVLANSFEEVKTSIENIRLIVTYSYD